jgi:lysyl-tRNA synthetase class 2
MGRLERIVQQRLDKLEKLRSQGINPYPHCYHRSHTAREALALYEQQENSVTGAPALDLAGRIVAARFMGKAAFLNIQDSSGKIQLFFNRGTLGDEKYAFLHDLDIGDFIGVTGTLFRTRTGEITLQINDFSLLAKALHPLPEKWHGLADVEKRYRQRYLDLISNEEILPLFVRRSQIIAEMRRFMQEQGFTEVETPVLQPVAGGALARPFVTHHHALDQDLYLRIALELYLKRLIVGGMDKVFEIGRVFRNEGISTKHNPEFTMMECYQAYADYNDMMSLVENMFSTIAQQVLDTTGVPFNGQVINLHPPWKRVPLRDAIKESCGIDFDMYPDVDSLRKKMKEIGVQVDPAKDRGRLIDELLSTYVEPHLIQPTFLYDYPVEMSPLAKRKRDDEHLVERFEAFIGGMEVANSFTELNNPLEQEERFKDQAREHAKATEGGGY